MMRIVIKYWIYTLFLILGTNIKCNAQDIFLSHQEAIEDLEVFLDVLNHHPGVGHYQNGTLVDSLSASLREEIGDSISYHQFYLNLLHSLTLLKDGHTGISLGSQLSTIKRSPTTLPFRYKIIGQEIFVVDILDLEQRDFLYTKIVSINHIPSDSILATCYKYTTADDGNIFYKKRYNERIFGQNFDFFFGPCDQYELIAITPKNDTIRKKIKGITDYEAIMKETQSKPLDCLYDVKNNLAKLQINTFQYRGILESGQNFHDFIDVFFIEVRKKKIENIVIDLRENWGGSSLLAMGLFAYLSPVDFNWVDYSLTYLDGSEAFAKHSQHPDGHYNFFKNHDTIRMEDFKLKVINGLDSKPIQSSTKIPFGPKKKIKDISKNKFYGNIFILTSGITFSAGSVFASKCAQLEKVKIIGEPTGGASGQFCGGGYLIVSLPHSEFKFELPIMERHFAIPDERADPKTPLKPDFMIKKDIHTFISNIDPEMEKVYELIQE